MNTKYAIFDAVTAENTFFDTKEEAIEAFWAHVVSFAKTHFNNTAYMVVEQNEDGTETWYNDNNTVIYDPTSARAKAERLIPSELRISNPTPIEVLP